MKKVISITLAILIVLLALPVNALNLNSADFKISVFEGETLEPQLTPEATPEVTAEPPVSTPLPTAEPTIEPTPIPTAELTAEPIIEPTIEPTAEPTIEPTPTEKPTPVPTPTPTIEPTPVPTPTPTLMLISTSTYTEDGTYLYGVLAKTSAEAVIANFLPGNIRIISYSGAVLSKSSSVGTGAKVQLMDGENVIDSLTVLVEGDVNGDGAVNNSDTAAMQAHIEGKVLLDSSFFSVANIVSDTLIDTKDVLALQKIISGIEGGASAVALPNTVKFKFSSDKAKANDELTVTVSIVPASSALCAFELSIPVSTDAFSYVDGSLKYLATLDKASVGGASYSAIKKSIMCNYSDITAPLIGETNILEFKVRVNESFEGGKAVLETASQSFMLDGKGTSIPIENSCTELVVYAEHPEFEYTVDGSRATITRYKGKSSTVVIPDTISGFDVVAIADKVFENNMTLEKVETGEKLESIGKRAFAGCGILSSVTFDSPLLTVIGDEAFYGCARLRNVVLPTGVVSIGNYAFYGCSGIVSVSLPDSLKTIGDYAFYGCANIVSINITRAVDSIGYRALSSCTKLRTITVSAANTVYSSVEGILYSADKKTLILCPAGKSGEVTIPETVEVIEKSAFEGCGLITRVDILGNITSIGNEAFLMATSLEGAYFHGLAPVNFGENVFSYAKENFTVYCLEQNLSSFAPNGETTYKGYPLAVFDNTPAPTPHPDYDYKVENSNAVITGYKGAGGYIEIPSMMLEYPVVKIADEAFSGVSSITGALIPDSVNEIGNRAFYNCTALEDITLSNGVKTIGAYAFAYSGINSVTLTDSVVSVGERAFANCPNMTNAVISSSVKTINGNVFAYSPTLTQITVQDKNANYSSVNGMLYNKDKTKLIACPSGKSGTCTTVKTLETIGEYAFAGCAKITKIALSANTSAIEDFAFDSTTSLMSFEVSPFNTHYVALDGMLYTYDKTVFVACPAGKAGSASIAQGTKGIAANAFNHSQLASISIPESVTDIYEYAFSDSVKLERIMIPESVVMIGNGAFAGCSKLKTADFYGKPPAAFGNNVFENTSSGFVIRYLEWNKSYWSPTGANNYKGYPIEPFAVLRLNEKSAYTIETKYSRIGGISENTTVEAFLKNFTPATMRVLDTYGKELRDVNLVGTGCKVQLIDASGNVMDELDIIMEGDATGDARIDSRDIAVIQSHILEMSSLSGVYLNAADLTGDGTLRSNDLVVVLKHIIGIKQINGNKK
ncbi:MAG: leucine-rich repeat protein [Clostridia bacterium]|nr:leucine-rich repeat protein [Clostridia bacterium]